MQCIQVDLPTLGFQHNGYSHMRNMIKNTFKSMKFQVLAKIGNFEVETYYNI